KTAFDTDLELDIPTGTSIVNGRSNDYFADDSNELTRDNSHLEDTVDRYIAAMTVFISLFGASPYVQVSYVTEAHKAHLDFARISAQKAVDDTYKVSQV